MCSARALSRGISTVSSVRQQGAQCVLLLSMAALFRLSPAWASWQPICLSLAKSVLLLQQQLLILNSLLSLPALMFKGGAFPLFVFSKLDLWGILSSEQSDRALQRTKKKTFVCFVQISWLLMSDTWYSLAPVIKALYVVINVLLMVNKSFI